MDNTYDVGRLLAAFKERARNNPNLTVVPSSQYRLIKQVYPSYVVEQAFTHRWESVAGHYGLTYDEALEKIENAEFKPSIKSSHSEQIFKLVYKL